jgi:hypothetical protein
MCRPLKERKEFPKIGNINGSLKRFRKKIKIFQENIDFSR